MENLENFYKKIKTWKPNNCPCRLCEAQDFSKNY